MPTTPGQRHANQPTNRPDPSDDIFLLLGAADRGGRPGCGILDGVNIEDPAIDRIRRDALLCHFTVPGEALGQRCCTRGGRLKHAADQFDAWRLPDCLVRARRLNAAANSRACCREGDSAAAAASRSAACWARSRSVADRESSGSAAGRGGAVAARSVSQVMTAPAPAPVHVRCVMAVVRDASVQPARARASARGVMVEFASCRRSRSGRFWRMTRASSLDGSGVFVVVGVNRGPSGSPGPGRGPAGGCSFLVVLSFPRGAESCTGAPAESCTGVPPSTTPRAESCAGV